MNQLELAHALRKQLLMYKCVRYELISLPSVRLFESDVRTFLYWSGIPVCGFRHVDYFLSPQTPVAIITVNFTVHPFWNIEIDDSVFHLKRLIKASK